MRKILLALVPMIAIGTANAKTTDKDFELRTAQNLYNLCTTDNRNPARERAVYFCVGYIDGALDLYQSLVKIGRLVPVSCLPPTLTRIQVALAFIEWGKANPKRLNQSAMDGLGEAAEAKWPCPKKSRK